MNPTFKQRLIETAFGLLLFLIAGIFVGGFALLVFLLSHWHMPPVVHDVIAWILLVGFGSFFAYLVVMVVIAIGKFIYWLFIEPFRK